MDKSYAKAVNLKVWIPYNSSIDTLIEGWGEKFEITKAEKEGKITIILEEKYATKRNDEA